MSLSFFQVFHTIVTTLNKLLIPALVSGGLSFASVSAGDRQTCGLTAASEAYCWGYNYAGQLGDGTTTTRLTPTLVSGGLSFASVSQAVLNDYACGVETAGAAYCWGWNGNGQLGDGTTTQRLIPTLVSGGLSFASLSQGTFHVCALTPAGDAYCWGNNSSGQLGNDGATPQSMTPVPVVQ